MVFLDKKLKRKLRAARAGIIAVLGAQNNSTGKNCENSQAIVSKARDSLRAIRNLEARINSDVELKLQHGMNSDTIKEKKNKVTKRNGDESETSESVKKTKDESKASESVKKKSNKKQKRKNGDKKFEAEDGATREGVNHNEHGSTVEQLVASVEVSTGFERKNIETSQKIYVGAIPYFFSEDDIRSCFEGCGPIACIDCMTFPDTGKFRGIAIITFKIR
ncbi:uncharacterized protein LOC121786561 isoform X2 [Salvia splendens]|uniref:uncharacterized protein LOC121786561 isoform X2 n=1 Tax=Salvia splendens TaxID=180675 RepID=UPI001C272242|nr:uncharacterized protein LOC121786561 isoform X2 [Salvia splendens]